MEPGVSPPQLCHIGAVHRGLPCPCRPQLVLHLICTGSFESSHGAGLPAVPLHLLCLHLSQMCPGVMRSMVETREVGGAFHAGLQALSSSQHGREGRETYREKLGERTLASQRLASLPRHDILPSSVGFPGLLR